MDKQSVRVGVEPHIDLMTIFWLMYCYSFVNVGRPLLLQNDLSFGVVIVNNVSHLYTFYIIHQLSLYRVLTIYSPTCLEHCRIHYICIFNIYNASVSLDWEQHVLRMYHTLQWQPYSKRSCPWLPPSLSLLYFLLADIPGVNRVFIYPTPESCSNTHTHTHARARTRAHTHTHTYPCIYLSQSAIRQTGDTEI
jgi:hypothetical protein